MALFDNIGIEQHSVGHFAISKIWNSDIWGYSSFLDKSIDGRISGWITTCPFFKNDCWHFVVGSFFDISIFHMHENPIVDSYFRLK